MSGGKGRAVRIPQVRSGKVKVIRRVLNECLVARGGQLALELNDVFFGYRGLFGLMAFLSGAGF
jgi:hypothetical protein